MMKHDLAFLWVSLWPNVFAPSFWTLIGLGASHWRLARMHRKHHEQQMKALRGEESP